MTKANTITDKMVSEANYVFCNTGDIRYLEKQVNDFIKNNKEERL